MLTISKNQLRAALHCAATKDVRDYLCGVHIERAQCGDVHIVGTDGSLLFAGLIAGPVALCTQAGPWRLTVPIDVIKREAKGKGDLTLSATPDGRYMLRSSVFTPVDGAYPDWRRVCVSGAQIDARPEQCAQFDPDLLARGAAALKDWHAGGAKFCPHIYQSGPMAGVLTGCDMTGFVVVMSRRRTAGDGVYPFTPAAYKLES